MKLKILGLIILSLVLVLNSSATTILNPPVFNMTFNPGEGVYNSTYAEDLASGFNATVVSNTKYEFGYIGGGYLFDDTSGYMVTDFHNITGNLFSIAFWANIDSIDTSKTFIRIINVSNQDMIQVEGSGNKIRTLIFETAVNSRSTTTSSDAPLSEWFHFIAVWNSTKIATYINGQDNTGVNASVGVGCTLTNSSRTISIGGRKTNTFIIDGTMDELMIYPYALNATQAQTLYDSYNFSSITYQLKDESTNGILINGNLTRTAGGSTSTEETNNGLYYYKGIGQTTDKLVYRSDTTYPARTNYNKSVIGHNKFNLYLVSLLNGINQPVNIVDNSENPVNNATIIIYREIGGNNYKVSQDNSDTSGASVFFLESGAQYTIQVSKGGFTTTTGTLTANGEVRTVIIVSQTSIIEEVYTSGLLFDYGPTTNQLNANTTYDFSYNLTSSFYNITNCNVSLVNATGVITSTIGTFNITHCTSALSLYTGNQSDFSMIMYYEFNNSYNTSSYIPYNIYRIYEGNFSAKTLVDDIKNFASSGFNPYSRIILGFVIVILIVGFVTEQVGATFETTGQIVLACFLIFLLSFMGFFTLTYEKMPDLPYLKQYFIFILCALVGSAYIISTETGK